MNQHRFCPECGAELPTESAEGLCTNCLPKAGLEQSMADSDAGAEAPTIAPIAPSPSQLSDDRTPATVSLDSSSRDVDTEFGYFGDYELLEEIARGGMGVVYKARHQKLNRIAAVKMIIGGRFSSAEELQRFHVEAESAARLDHPGIVPIYESGEYDGQPFFAMKFIEGGSLGQQIERFRSDPRSAVTLLINVARAVHHAHQRGILHRDLKPANILIDEHDNPLITDLGLAKNTSGGSDLTNTGAVLGTPSYMPPEQASGDRTVTTAADIYALGAVMYELLTGQPPYQGSSAVDTVMQVLQSPLQPPRRIDSSVNSDLELICMKCLERDPDRRFASASDVANDLENWLLDKPISVKPPSLTSLASRWIRRNHRYVYFGFAVLMGLAITLPIALLFLAGGFGAVYDQFPDDQRPWVFSIGKMPTWVPLISLALLFFVFWPAIGLLNALVTRPTTIRKAIGIGTLMSILCSSIFCVLLGWAIIVIEAGNNSETHIRTLASAVWPPEDVDQAKAAQKATEMFDGLQDIPESKRARIIADRIVADQVADAPRSLWAIVLCCLILSAPVTYGTVLGQVLLQRRNRFWLVIIRYLLAWVSISVGALFAVVYLIGGKISVSSTPQPALTLTITVAIIVLVCSLIAFLSLRRWRRDKRSDP